MTNCLKIDWPRLDSQLHNQLIKCFDDNKSSVKMLSAKAPGSNDVTHVNYNTSNNKGFFHLFEWDTKEQFFSELLKDYSVNTEFLNKLSIQQSRGPVPPHADVNRKVIAYYLVEGMAQTVFYSTDKPVISGTSYHDKMHELTEIERVTMLPGSWYLFNTYQIHSVDCFFNTKRTSLAMDLTSIFNDYENAVKKIGLEQILFK
jgi:hypothetical protein